MADEAEAVIIRIRAGWPVGGNQKIIEVGAAVGVMAVLAIAGIVAVEGPLRSFYIVAVGGLGLIIIGGHTGEAFDIEIAIALPVSLTSRIAPRGI